MQNAEQLSTLIKEAGHIVVIQADNPDADSIASALALEQILGEMGKRVSLYCGIDMPGYLKYLPGWDRVSSELPSKFDLSIIVDASTMSLFTRLKESGHQGWVASKPCIVLDHHREVDNLIPFATVTVNQPDDASTGQVIYKLARQHNWPLDKTSAEFIMTSILGDTQGLSNDLTTAETYRIMADLVELGVDRPALEEQRRAYSKMPEAIFRYKARLITRTELHAENRVALITIPHDEIMQYSPLYNPNPLIQGEHLQTEGVIVSVAIKHYADDHVTASIRCNPAAPVAAALAESFNGGGHVYSSGFKMLNVRSLDDLKARVIAKATELLDQTNTHATLDSNHE